MGITVSNPDIDSDDDIVDIAALDPADGDMLYWASGTRYNTTGSQSYGRSLLDTASEAAFKALVNLEAGTDVQPYDDLLAALAGLTMADGKIVRGTGADAVELIDEGDIEVAATGESTTRTLSQWMNRFELGAAGDPIPLEPYAPAITRKDVDTGTGYYRHNPSCCVNQATGELVEAYLMHPSSANESQTGQVVVLRRSTSLTATPSAPVQELTSATYCTNPVTAADVQSEPWLMYHEALGEEWLVFTHRASEETSFLARRDASAGPATNKWTIYRLLFSTSDEGIAFSSSSISGAAPSGYALEDTLDGAGNAAPFLFKPVVDTVGNIIIPIVYVTTYGSSHWVGVLWSEDNGSTWKKSQVVPRGEVGAGESWEPSLVQTRSGRYRMNVRDLSGAENKKQAVTESLDLQTWSELKHQNANIHTNRIVQRKIRDGLYLGVGSAHYTNRNAISLLASGDGAVFSIGFQVDNAVDGTDYAHYSDLDIYDGSIVVTWSMGGVSDAAPNEIYRAVFSAPAIGMLPVMGNSKNDVEDNTSTKSATISGDILSVPPGGGAEIVMSGLAVGYSITYRVSVAPSSQNYQILTIGRGEDYKTVELRTDGKLYVNGEELRTPNDPTDWWSLQVIIDRKRWIATVGGIAFPIPKYSMLGVGDNYNEAADADGTIYVDVARSYIRPMKPDDLPYALGGNDLSVDTLYANDDVQVTKVGTGEQAQLFLDGDAGTFRSIKWRTAGTDRWYLGVDDEAESGSQTGSDFFIRARNDDGTFRWDVLTIDRDTGAMSFFGNIETTNGHLKVNRSGDSADANIFLQRDAGSSGLLKFRTGTSDRWYVGVDNAAESGSDAGSDFIIRARDDAGANLGDYLKITRSTGTASFVGAVNLNGGHLTINRQGDTADADIRVYADSGQYALRKLYVGSTLTWADGFDNNDDYVIRHYVGGSYDSDSLRIDATTGGVYLPNGIYMPNRGTKTISSGSISVSEGPGVYYIDTESAAASDDLDSVTDLQTSAYYVFMPANSSRDPTLKHATGNMYLGGDFTMDAITSMAVLYCRNGSDLQAQSLQDN